MSEQPANNLAYIRKVKELILKQEALDGEFKAIAEKLGIYQGCDHASTVVRRWAEAKALELFN